MNCPPQDTGRPSFPSLYNPLIERYRDCEQPYSSVTYLENAGDVFRFTLYWTLILYTPVFALPALWGLLVHFIPHRISRRRQRAREAVAAAAIVGGAGSRSSTNNLQYSVMSFDGQSNAEVLFPRSSEPFLLDSTEPATAAARERDRTIKLDDSAQRPRHPSSRPTIAQAFESWTPNRTLRTLRRKRDDSFALAPMSPVPSTRNIGVSQPQPIRRSSAQPPQALSSLRNRSTGITCLILTIPLVFVIVGAVVGVAGSLVIGYLLAALRGTAGVKISTWLPLGWAIIQVHTILLGCFTNMILFI